LFIDGIASSVPTGITSGSAFGTGNAGNVSVSAGLLAVSNGGEISATTDFGAGGSVKVSTGSLAISNRGEISATTFNTGVGGDVLVSVTGDLVINGIDPNSPTRTGIFARTLDRSGGNAGRVTVSADNISVLDSGAISTSTFGRGAAGEVFVSAEGKLAIEGGVIASSANIGTGNAGQVLVSARDLSFSHGGEIQSLTFTSGNGGNVDISARGAVSIDGSGVQGQTGVLTSAEAGSTGRAGCHHSRGPRYSHHWGRAR
jgi:large exoprotein involved in heme utilization and adhesion